jgi:hypothetical protein
MRERLRDECGQTREKEMKKSDEWIQLGKG